MNKRLNDLVAYLPASSLGNKKLDKLSILKMANQHLKNLKGSFLLVLKFFNKILIFVVQSFKIIIELVFVSKFCNAKRVAIAHCK